VRRKWLQSSIIQAVDLARKAAKARWAKAKKKIKKP
jgi:hypothetical protein